MLTCDLTGRLTAIDGRPMAFAPIRAKTDVDVGTSGQVHLSGQMSPGRGSASATTDINGDFTLTLAQGLCVLIYLPGVELPYRMVVPYLDTALLADHLFVRVASVEWAQAVLVGGEWEFQDLVLAGPDLYELPAGSTLNLVLRATFTNGEVAAFDLAEFDVTGGPYAEAADEQAYAVTQDVPGDVVASRASSDTVLSPDDDEFRMILLTLPEHDVSLPDDLTVRFT